MKSKFKEYALGQKDVNTVLREVEEYINQKLKEEDVARGK